MPYLELCHSLCEKKHIILSIAGYFKDKRYCPEYSFPEERKIPILASERYAEKTGNLPRWTWYKVQRGSVRVAEWLELPTFDQEVPGSDPAGGRINLMIVRRFIAQSLSLLSFHRLVMA